LFEYSIKMDWAEAQWIENTGTKTLEDQELDIREAYVTAENGAYKEVTTVLRDLVIDKRLLIIDTAYINALTGGDIAEGYVKTLSIGYGYNLVLYYDLLPSANTSTTNLTPISTNTHKRSITQYDFPLYNGDAKPAGTLEVINNLCVYSNTPDTTNNAGNYYFTINNGGYIERYSINLFNTSERDTTGFVVENEIRLLNLTSVGGVATFTKLKWIIPVNDQGVATTRTLVFYN